MLKKCLSSVLALSLALPTSKAFAQSSSADSVQLILQAMSTPDTNEAQQLLQLAHTRLNSEGLSQNDETRIYEILNHLTQTLKNANGGASTGSQQTYQTIPNTPALQSTQTTGAAPASESSKALEEIIAANPAARRAMWEIGHGRLNRSIQEIPDLIKKQKGIDLGSFDQNEAQKRIDAEAPGSFIGFLKKHGLINLDNTKDIDTLKRLETLPLNELADQIIWSTVLKAGAMGSAKGMTLNRVPVYQHPAMNVLQNKFGIIGGSELVAMWVNVDLAIRLTKLYSVHMNEADLDSLVRFVYGFTRFLIGRGPDKESMKQAQAEINDFMDKAKTPGGATAALGDAMDRNPKVATGIAEFDKNAQRMKTELADIKLPESEKATGTKTKQKTDANPEKKPEQKSQQKKTKEVTEKAKVKAQKMARSAGKLIGEVIKTGSAFAAETALFGYWMKYTLQNARKNQKQLENAAFRHFLMNHNGGEGFIKLLILSADLAINGPEATQGASPLKETDKVKFILNLARSARVCSPQDREQFQKLIEKQKSSLPSFDIEQNRAENRLRYACDNNLSLERYDRMIKEFYTYNEIPHHYISDLRLAGRENRLRMGELLLQFYYLDGSFQPAEVEQFNQIRTKVLGFTTPDEAKYFERVDSFIWDQGGMIADINSPTGFKVRNSSSSNPYTSGYFSTNGPDTPPEGRPSPAPVPGSRTGENAPAPRE